MRTHRVAIILGTRPEAIKLAPVILKMQEESSLLHPVVCVTGQHRQMLDQVLAWFDIRPDHDLNLMQVNQNLAELSARALTGVSELLTHLKPDAVIIQGDTTTAAVAGLAAFYQRIPVGHVEAGLRTGNIYSPFPEEINRRITGVLASLHFAPTKMAVDALLAERVDPGSVFLVGNTVVDALRLTVARKDEITPAFNFNERSESSYPNRFVLVTAHRRESFGSPFESICRAVRSLIERNRDVEVVYPVHLNPNVRDPVSRLLQGIPRLNLIEPANYQQFVQLMLRSYLILTDSGGIQEEATVLGKPTLVMRETTERREAVEAGTALLVGTDESRILSTAENLLHDRDAYERMAQAKSPFGNGYSSQEIVRILQRHLEAADT